MGKTSIEWCDKVWNPVRGCSRVSAGCGTGREGGCYAEKMAARFSGPGMPYEGLATIGKHGARWTGEVRFVPEHLSDPLRWKKPARVFVNSMSDLFHEKLTNEEIAAVFGVMAACPRHTFQVLTKRPGRMLEWFRWMAERDPVSTMHVETAPHLAEGEPDEYYEDEEPAIVIRNENAMYRLLDAEWPLPNVWLGVSVEDQATADERIPALLGTPAAVRFISAEPLLAPVRVDDIGLGGGDVLKPLVGLLWSPTSLPLPQGMIPIRCPRLDWVIVGGESGPRARPCALEWIEGLVDQCRAAGTPVFVKQLGAFVVSESRAYDTEEEAKRDGFNSRWLWRAGLAKGNKKGNDLAQLTPELNIRMFPGDAWAP